MTDWQMWLAAAGAVVILELFTGTFYLLMIAIGLACGAVAAIFGLTASVQTVAAAVVGIIATVILHRSKFGRTKHTEASRDANVNMDIGQTLSVKKWSTDESGNSTARVMYRGAMWDIELAKGASAEAGTFTIREVLGSRLIVSN